jgi:hypothetical protein
VPALIDAMPADALQAATLTSPVEGDANGLAFGNLAGNVNGAGVSGSLAIRVGARPAVAANLRLDGPVLDRWVPAMPTSLTDAAARLAALPQGVAGFDADVSLTATAPVLHGETLGRLTIEARASNGTIEVRRAALTAPEFSLGASGTVSAGGKIADGRLDVSLAHAEALASQIPPSLEFARTLLAGPATLGAMLSGGPNALAITAATELSDARLQVNGTADLVGRRWKGPVALHHPGAPRLLGALGFGDTVAWLGNGSLSVQAVVDAAPDHMALSGLEMSAGSLRMTGDAALTGLGTPRRTVTAKLEADTLPLPAIDLQSNSPWSLGLLATTDAAVSLRAAHVLWGQAALADQAAVTIGVAGGIVRLDGMSAKIAGGTLSGRAALDASMPPKFSVSAKLADMAVDGPLTGLPMDLVGGHVDGTMDLSGTGYSPAGLLATLGGAMHLTVQDGTLAGVDAGRAMAELTTAAGPAPDAVAIQSAMAEALRSGGTPFTRLDVDGNLARGTLTIGHSDMALAGGSIATTGTIDFPGEAIDAHLALRPALEKAPVIGLRIIGPAASPSRSPELADLARWLADR